jgi:hypothetical protein
LRYEAGIKKPMLVEPSTLNFQEAVQDRKSELTADTDDFDPIVVIGEGANLSILDGHNRASVALDRGDELLAVRVTSNEYENLKEKGFDDGEIAWAALQRANQGYAAGNLNSQFPGSEIDKGGSKAWDELLETDADIRKSIGGRNPGEQAISIVNALNMGVKPPEPGRAEKAMKMLKDEGENPSLTKE